VFDGSMGALQDEQGRTAEATSAGVLQPASARPMDAAAVRKAVGSTLGPDTVFSLGNLDLSGAYYAAPVLISLQRTQAAVPALCQC
jgi:hypothetical protein